MTKDKSTYINGLPEAEYQIIDTGLGENIFDRFLEKNSGVLANTFANLIDKYAADKKGRLFTAAITAAGYSNDPEGLQEFYTNNAQAIDEYFKFVDMQALAAAIGGDLEEEIIMGSVEWFRARIPAFLTGAGILTLILYIRNRRR